MALSHLLGGDLIRLFNKADRLLAPYLHQFDPRLGFNPQFNLGLLMFIASMATKNKTLVSKQCGRSMTNE
jgi:hypothetical protein